MLGGHLLKSWSSTQPSISLSSGEAEYYGVVKAAGIALGQQSLMSDLGMKVAVRVWTDSSAAVGICGRSGLGKLRHVQTHTLWVQERVRSGAIELRKVCGDVNPADLFTKHLASRDRVNQLVELFNCEYREGRAHTAPELRRSPADTGGLAVGGHDGGHDGEAWRNSGPSADTAHVHEQGLSHALEASGSEDLFAHIAPHDPSVLPHEYLQEDVDKLFPIASAPEELDCAPVCRCICGRPDCGACFPPRAPEFGPAVERAEAWIMIEGKYPRRLVG